MNARLTRLRAEMDRLGLDAVWINSPENYLYFSYFDNPDGWMLITNADICKKVQLPSIICKEIQLSFHIHW